MIVTGYTLFETSSLRTNVLAKCVNTTCIFRDAGAAIGQGSSRYVEVNANL